MIEELTRESTNLLAMKRKPIVRSDLQREASRLNGAISRGPLTVLGKQKSRINALRHGLFSRVLPLVNTRQTDKTSFDVMLKNLIEDLKPESQLELNQVEILAVDFSHLQRVLFLINAHMDDDQFNNSSSIDYDDAYMISEAWENTRKTLLNLLEHVEDGTPIGFLPEQLDTITSTLWAFMTEAREELKNLPPIRHSLGVPARDDSWVDVVRQDCKALYRMNDPSGIGLRTKKDLRDVLAGMRSIDTVHQSAWIQRLRNSVRWAAERAKAKRHSIEKTEREQKRLGLRSEASLETLLRIDAHLRRQIANGLLLLDCARRLRAA